MKRLGVIDLGTNTFHLLIVRSDEQGGFEELYRERIFIKLAENGIEYIGEAPFQRGLAAIKTYCQVLQDYEVDQVKAFGTAALRTAANGTEFIQQVKALSGLDIQLIPGTEEARYIFKGVRQAVPFGEEKALIMDIGGGSVEFIIADQNQFYWADSFPIGVAILFHQFHKTDPIHPSEIQEIEAFLEKQLAPLFKNLQEHNLQILIGASGTFDVIQDLLAKTRDDSLYARVNVDQFHPFYQLLLQTTLQERLDLPKIPETRADMIIVALILIHFVIRKAKLQQIVTSAYAMKEGMLYDMIHSEV